MDILIKNMEKPTNCFTCILSEVSTDFGKLVCLRLGKDCGNTILEDCPLVELPPHGRLVDIDRMIADGRKARNVFPVCIESMDDLADFLETYAELDKTDHTIVLEAST